MNEEARAAWSCWFAEGLAKRLEADDWPSVIDRLTEVVGVDLDAELARLSAADSVHVREHEPAALR